MAQKNYEKNFHPKIWRQERTTVVGEIVQVSIFKNKQRFYTVIAQSSHLLPPLCRYCVGVLSITVCAEPQSGIQF